MFINLSVAAEELSRIDLLKTKWSFEGIFGKFDRSALQRGYQVYNEVCSSCHSIQYLSYRNLTEKGGPEFSEEQAKKIAASFEVIDGPNSEGEMFTRPGRLSDQFIKPYSNWSPGLCHGCLSISFGQRPQSFDSRIEWRRKYSASFIF